MPSTIADCPLTRIYLRAATMAVTQQRFRVAARMLCLALAASNSERAGPEIKGPIMASMNHLRALPEARPYLVKSRLWETLTRYQG